LNFTIKLENNIASDEELLSDLQDVANKLKSKKVTIVQYNEYGKYHPTTLINRFDTWNDTLEKIGLEAGKAKNHVSDDELFKNLQRIWEYLGRQPTAKEIKKPLSKFAFNTYARRFKSWNKALINFSIYINSMDDIKISKEALIDEYKETNIKEFKHKTKRNISDRLRFSILMRDGFTCQSCGRSPTTERGVKLHVDHIMPWSKGGETEEENLETKCQQCNLGKGNAFNK